MMEKLLLVFWSIFQGHDTSADLRWALWDSTMYIVRENPVWGLGGIHFT